MAGLPPPLLQENLGEGNLRWGLIALSASWVPAASVPVSAWYPTQINLAGGGAEALTADRHPRGWRRAVGAVGSRAEGVRERWLPILETSIDPRRSEGDEA